MLQRFPVIVAPTAAGKSALAVELALASEGTTPRRGEIITADSMQVYRGMDIGTAKPTLAERRGVPHHLLDLLEPDDPQAFTVDRWVKLAEQTITDIRARDGVPIVVGGSNLYVKALLDGLFQGPPADPVWRAHLASLAPGELRRRLESLDPPAAARIHPNDTRRTIRALEVHHATGRPITSFQTQWEAGAVRSDALLVGVEWPVPALNQRINARVRRMVELGFVEEAHSLWENGRLGPQPREALGYKQLIDHFEGRATLEEALERIKIETRRFAKNQRTWLRRFRTRPGALWLMAPETDDENWLQTSAKQIVTALSTNDRHPSELA